MSDSLLPLWLFISIGPSSPIPTLMLFPLIEAAGRLGKVDADMGFRIGRVGVTCSGAFKRISAFGFADSSALAKLVTFGRCSIEVIRLIDSGRCYNLPERHVETKWYNYLKAGLFL